MDRHPIEDTQGLFQPSNVLQGCLEKVYPYVGIVLRIAQLCLVERGNDFKPFEPGVMNQG